MPRFTAGPIAVSVGAPTIYPCYTHGNNNRNSDQKSYKPIKCSFQQIGEEFCFFHSVHAPFTYIVLEKPLLLHGFEKIFIKFLGAAK